MLHLSLLPTETAIGEETFEAIRNYTHQTAFNTEFGLWDGIAIAISLFSLICTAVTLYSQWQTEKNTRRLTLKLQKALLVDLVRHLYRNLVVVYTMKHKLEQCGFRAYPSEEHLVKLKIPLENLHLEIFNQDAHYLLMYELYCKFNNYNEEIDIAGRHLASADLPDEVKRRDLETQMFKPGFLAACIADTLTKIWGADAVSAAVGVIEQAHRSNVKNNGTPQPSEGYIPYANDRDGFVRAFFAHEAKRFFGMFNQDVAIESGVNSQQSPKIYLIKF